MPNRHGIDFLLDQNRKSSDLFLSQEDDRKRYQDEHRTKMVVPKCSDGRLNLSVWTQRLLGILYPLRTIGGEFSLEWPHFQDIIRAWRWKSDEKSCNSLVLTTYHYSQGSKDRGCAGHECDINSARRSSFALRDQFNRIFGSVKPPNDTRLFAITVGLETDHQKMILHGQQGSSLDLSTLIGMKDEEVLSRLRSLYPAIDTSKPTVLTDFFQLVRGNIQHIQDVQRTTHASEDIDHRESVLAVGRGFDWLHLPNRAIIIGTWKDKWVDDVRTGAKIIQENLDCGRLNDHRIVLLTSGVYEDDYEGQGLAREKSLYLARVTTDVIRNEFKKLVPRLQTLVSTVDLRTRKLDIVERHEKVAGV
jgi:hypothetical protein